MAQGKQAKVLTDKQQDAVLAHLETTRHPVRNRVIFLLSMKAGLRAKEIASLRWRGVCDASGVVSDEINIEDIGSKGKGGRTIPVNPKLREALVAYQADQGFPASDCFVVQTERSAGSPVSAQVIVNLFQRWFTDLGMHGASSHSGRRTFITNAAKKISTVGGSLRDVQQLAGHSSLQTTQRYIEGSTEAKKAIVQLV
jgi:integrase